jgi:hypothetical protein
MTAGAVLMHLYMLVCAGWQLPPGRAPSLNLAYECAAALGRKSNAHAAGDGQVQVRMHESAGKAKVCFNQLRAVSHLWAALLLHSLGRNSGLEHILADRVAGIGRLLAMARPLQDFMLAYRDPINGREIVQVDELWLVPPGPRLAIAWNGAPMPAFIAAAVRDHRAERTKGKRAKRLARVESKGRTQDKGRSRGM